MSGSLCACGHPKQAHGPQEWPRGQAGCRATIYERVERGPETSGMNAWPCKCRQFKEAP